jgi:hypothetical protein
MPEWNNGFGQLCYGGASQISSAGETRIFA